MVPGFMLPAYFMPIMHKVNYNMHNAHSYPASWQWLSTLLVILFARREMAETKRISRTFLASNSLQ